MVSEKIHKGYKNAQLKLKLASLSKACDRKFSTYWWGWLCGGGSKHLLHRFLLHSLSVWSLTLDPWHLNSSCYSKKNNLKRMPICKHQFSFTFLTSWIKAEKDIKTCSDWLPIHSLLTFGIPVVVPGPFVVARLFHFIIGQIKSRIYCKTSNI